MYLATYNPSRAINWRLGRPHGGLQTLHKPLDECRSLARSGGSKIAILYGKNGFLMIFVPLPNGLRYGGINWRGSLPHMWEPPHKNSQPYLQVGGGYNTRSYQIWGDFFNFLKFTYFGWVKWLPPTQNGSTQSPYT